MSAVMSRPLRAPRRLAIAIFAVFAFAYFFSALLRAVTATLAPAFSAELGLSAADLGLLAGAYFLGFALMQLPLGRALDRYGPRHVLMAFLSLAVMACAAFALARGFATLLVARALIGVGVSACLMAPLTAYRHRFGAPAQLRANSWMLMTGSLGMLASTVPVQWLLPVVGWRGLFWAIAVLLALSILLIGMAVPRDEPLASVDRSAVLGYRQIFRHPYFVRLAPLAFAVYGGLVAVQSLWAGPWLTEVGGRSAAEAARGLFAINFSMLLAFLGWGTAMPYLTQRGWQVDRLIAFGVPVALILLFGIVWLGPQAGPAWWATWCVACSFLSLSQPAVAMAFPPAAAGRALSAFNLVIFAGVFCVQWGIGLAIDALLALGWPRVSAFRAAFASFALACTIAYGWFFWRGRTAAENSSVG
jgi:predicted MFS family arabinose efflux permease